MSEHRREDDQLFTKIYRLWPILLSLIALISFAVTLKAKVDQHETRIARLEANMGQVLDNTNLLVSQLVRKH